jgi:diacylglycerol kinase (ATP)
MLKEVIKGRIQSFKYAFRGIFHLFRAETNARIHLFAAILAISLGFFFSLTWVEWSILLLCIFAVLAAEAFNTAIEELTNLVSPDHHPLAGKAKDLAAGAVLLIAIGAAFCGILLFLPKILNLLFLY